MANPTVDILRTYPSLAEAARDALAVQGACNLSGVVRSFTAAMTAIPLDSTSSRNRHPVAVLFAYKCAALAGFEPIDFGLSDAFAAAEAECKRLAEEGA